jgi:hypothetical protein
MENDFVCTATIIGDIQRKIKLQKVKSGKVSRKDSHTVDAQYLVSA